MTEPHDATLFGLNLESPGLVAAAVLLAIGLSLAVWFRASKPVLWLLIVYGLVFAAFDVAEVMHQSAESRTGIAAIAALVAALHLAVAVMAGFGLKKQTT